MFLFPTAGDHGGRIRIDLPLELEIFIGCLANSITKSDFLKEEKKKKKRMAVTTSKGLKFARKQLEKHGWKKGAGLHLC